MTVTEKLKCNICGLVVISSDAKSHASSASHNELKEKLESELNALRNRDYSGDSSVIVRWKSSV